MEKEIIDTSDSPIKNSNQDCFDQKKYVDAFLSIITTTNTPFTCSIQGEWGSGKTSFINQVLSKIDKTKFQTLIINVREYAQFQESEISTHVLKDLIFNILPHNSKDKLIKIVDKRRAINLGKYAITSKITNSLGIQKKDLMRYSRHRIGDAIFQETTSEITYFKKEIFKAIKKSGKKYVVFIDDLDRVTPDEAVNVLEAIQIFMSISGCLFIFAIDYPIVIEGYKKRFGDTCSDSKAQSYFDKLIQLPFTIPRIKRNSIGKYFMSLMSEHGINPIAIEQKEIEIFCRDIEDILTSSIGDNPRKIKRLSNWLLLNSKISENSGENYNFDILGQLYFISMQIEFEALFLLIKEYSMLENNKSELPVFINNLLENYANTSTSNSQERSKQSREYEEFVEEFDNVISKISQEKNTDEHITRKKVMKFLEYMDNSIPDAGKVFENLFYEYSDNFVERSLVSDEDISLIARVVINMKNNSNIDIDKIEKALAKNSEIMKKVNTIFSSNEQKTPNQFLIEFNDFQPKDIQWEIKRLLNAEHISFNRITAHKYYYGGRREK